MQRCTIEINVSTTKPSSRRCSPIHPQGRPGRLLREVVLPEDDSRIALQLFDDRSHLRQGFWYSIMCQKEVMKCQELHDVLY